MMTEPTVFSPVDTMTTVSALPQPRRNFSPGVIENTS